MNYLYNGVELPALPVWDKDAYPCAMICLSADKSNWICIASDVPFKQSGSGFLDTADAINYVKSEMRDGAAAWGAFEGPYYNEPNPYGWFITPVWANCDIYSAEDPTVITLRASTPVPMTDHNALTQGWIVGKRLAAQRGKA